MKRLVLSFLLIMGLFLSPGLQAQQNAPVQGPTSSSAARTGGSKARPAPESRVLVVYFSYSGNTREVAHTIHSQVGGRLFEIQTVNPYPRDYDAVVKQAKQELETGYRPRLKNQVADFATFQVVFLGYPNWWGTMPMPVATFLSEHDFSGKIIAPFCTHEGSRLGRSVADIQKLCPGATVLEGLAIRGRDAKKAQGDVSEWLRGIQMPVRE